MNSSEEDFVIANISDSRKHGVLNLIEGVDFLSHKVDKFQFEFHKK